MITLTLFYKGSDLADSEILQFSTLEEALYNIPIIMMRKNRSATCYIDRLEIEIE